MSGAIRPGVLALQGDVEPHVLTLAKLGHAAVQIRRPAQLAEVTHIVLPGGESTTLHHLLQMYGLWEAIRARAADGTLGVFGTCAGAILLGRAHAERPPRMGLVDVGVERNAYGRQIDSFVAEISFLGKPLEAVFIRAPRFRAPGAGVRALAAHGDDPVLVQQGRLLAATFHPELSGDTRVHEYFLSL